ncbi:MAG: tetratricopeptide repeat protein, partial [Symploca sp. SIO2E6]|nr:tetratricopeptide repeat protein [Symploca sp. SIO2E6]
MFISREIADHAAEESSLHGLGWVYRNLGQYSKALEFHQQALALARKRGHSDQEAFILVEIGIVYSDLAQYERALESLQQSLQILQTTEQQLSDVEHFALNKIGSVYRKLGQYDRALELLQKALLKGGFDKQNILKNIGEVYFQQGDYANALESYQKALELPPITGDPAAKGFILNNIGLTQAQTGEFTQALETYRKALALFKQLNDRPGERTTLSNIGVLLEQQNKPELAVVFYKEAVNITETIRQNLNDLSQEEQKAYTETVADTYRRLANLLLSQGRILEAQQVLELLKVQELRNFTKDTRAGGEETTGIITNPTEAEILSTHGSLIALGRKIEECQQCEQRSQLLDQREVIAQEFEENVQSLKQIIRDRLDKD